MAELLIPTHIKTAKHNPAFNERAAQTFLALQPAIVWDIGAGDGYYGKVFRHLLPGVRVHAVEANADWRPVIDDLYDTVEWADIKEHIEHISGDLILFGDVLEHLPRDDAFSVLRKARQRFAHVLVIGPVGWQPQPHPVSWEVHRCGIERSDFTADAILEYAEADRMMFCLLRGEA